MAKTKSESTGQVEARVLISGSYGPVDSVVTVDVQVANDDPDLDPTPEAVAYAKSIAQPTE